MIVGGGVNRGRTISCLWDEKSSLAANDPVNRNGLECRRRRRTTALKVFKTLLVNDFNYEFNRYTEFYDHGNLIRRSDQRGTTQDYKYKTAIWQSMFQSGKLDKTTEDLVFY